MDYLQEEFERYIESVEGKKDPCPTCGKPTTKQFCSTDCFLAYMR